MTARSQLQGSLTGILVLTSGLQVRESAFSARLSADVQEYRASRLVV
jgi:hypothetical protein